MIFLSILMQTICFCLSAHLFRASKFHLFFLFSGKPRKFGLPVFLQLCGFLFLFLGENQLLPEAAADVSHTLKSEGIVKVKSAAPQIMPETLNRETAAAILQNDRRCEYYIVSKLLSELFEFEFSVLSSESISMSLLSIPNKLSSAKSLP